MDVGPNSSIPNSHSTLAKNTNHRWPEIWTRTHWQTWSRFQGGSIFFFSKVGQFWNSNLSSSSGQLKALIVSSAKKKINKHSDHQSDQKCCNNHSGHQVHHQRLGQGPPKWTKGHQWCLWFIWKSCVSSVEFYFQNICVLHITWYYQKVVANFRLGDRWEKNQLTWFLTKVIIVIDVLIFIIFIIFIISRQNFLLTLFYYFNRIFVIFLLIQKIILVEKFLSNILII